VCHPLLTLGMSRGCMGFCSQHGSPGLEEQSVEGKRSRRPCPQCRSLERKKNRHQKIPEPEISFVHERIQGGAFENRAARAALCCPSSLLQGDVGAGQVSRCGSCRSCSSAWSCSCGGSVTGLLDQPCLVELMGSLGVGWLSCFLISLYGCPASQGFNRIFHV